MSISGSMYAFMRNMDFYGQTHIPPVGLCKVLENSVYGPQPKFNPGIRIDNCTSEIWFKFSKIYTVIPQIDGLLL